MNRLESNSIRVPYFILRSFDLATRFPTFVYYRNACWKEKSLLKCVVNNRHSSICKSQVDGCRFYLYILIKGQFKGQSSKSAMVTAEWEIMLNLTTQHKLGILQRLVVEQPVKLRLLCRSVAVFVLNSDADKQNCDYATNFPWIYVQSYDVLKQV